MGKRKKATDTDLLQRFMEMDGALARLNEGAATSGQPWLLADDYAHFACVRVALSPYANAQNLSSAERQALLWFCYRDTHTLAAHAAPFDPRLVVGRYFSHFAYRSGNRDTPDDRPEKMDWERLGAYRDAREKAWRGTALTARETALLREPAADILRALQQEAGAAALPE